MGTSRTPQELIKRYCPMIEKDEEEKEETKILFKALFLSRPIVSDALP